MSRYKQVRAGGVVFHFAYDPDDPSLLHIFARHLATIENALDTWFDPDAEEIWNEERRRYETSSELYVLYWTWLTENERVLIISCFSRDD